jgi:hypothetical protein
VGGSKQQIVRRLQLLYHHGYLERPHAQLEYYGKSGSRHLIYGLGNKAAGVLKNGARSRDSRWSEKNRSVRRVFFEHALLVSDIMVSFELSCRATAGIKFVSADELKLPGSTDSQIKWRVRLNGHARLGIIPDRMFALDSVGGDGRVNRAFFFLEADRGTMPVIRKNLAQSSCYRKLLAYEATWTQRLHHKVLGLHRFRVLTVTKSAKRVDAVLRACAQLKSGRGLFLFCDEAAFKAEDDIFKVVWKTGTGENALLP